MAGLKFTVAAPVAAHPLRADIALFVGFVTSRRGAVSNRPVEVDSWEVFDDRFAWDQRSAQPNGGDSADTYLGAAVRAFFDAGGRKCWVVAAGDPWPLQGRRDSERQYDLLPRDHQFSTLDRESWRGIAHVLGLPEVSFLCLPDLPDLFAIPPPAPRPAPPPTSPELFVECGSRLPTPPGLRRLAFAAPRCDRDGFQRWATFVARVGRFLSAHGREVQLVAAVPQPVDQPAARAAQWDTIEFFAAAREQTPPPLLKVGAAFVQLAYPWARLRNGARIPEALEPPDGLLAGVLANNALVRGTFQSAAGTRLPAVVSVTPELGRNELERIVPATDPEMRALLDRVSLIGPGPGGIELLSDVTTDGDEAYRPANVNRLVSAIVRAARLAGELHVFDNNGEELWGRLRDSIGGFLTDLWHDGALEGVSVDEAFTVKCDRSTMTQNDLDAGRVLVTIQFTASAPITEINVVLSMDEGGQVSRWSAGRKEAA
ncbi:MAG TPA: phage tail sheath protein [Verrucomicrobiota bacterium]|nr:phage tail sheath protein [Verrucomicrobiales bacterium]HRI13128.1 phage tail sheath protein [Verrucomicrobiota bacterium]